MSIEPVPDETTHIAEAAEAVEAASGPSDERLPCGELVDEILEQVASHHETSLNAHQQDCPHCQASLREFAQLWSALRNAESDGPPMPTTVVDDVMGRIRTLVRDVWYTLEITDGGSLRVAGRVVAVLARDAARRVPGVRVALGRSTASRAARIVEKATLGHRHPHSAVGVLGRTAAVDLALAIAYGPSARTVGEQVQQAVVTELRQAIGLTSVIVNVTIDDVYP